MEQMALSTLSSSIYEDERELGQAYHDFEDSGVRVQAYVVLLRLTDTAFFYKLKVRHSSSKKYNLLKVQMMVSIF